MRTVGQLLKDARLVKGFTLEQVEKATKIRYKFLTAIEADDFQKLPAFPYIQGFIKNYSDFVGLRSPTMLALFRRQYTLKERQKREHIEEPLTQSSWQITPNKVIFVLVVGLIIGFFSYFYAQYRALHAKPPLEVEHPSESGVVVEDTIAVYGQTDPDATITINQEAALVKEDGKFYKDVTLNPGENTLVIEAVSRRGIKTTLTRKVSRAP